MIINLPIDSWTSLLNQLNITAEINYKTENSQEAITAWCRQHIKSDFQFVSFSNTEAFVEHFLTLNRYPSLQYVVKAKQTVLHEAAALGYDQFLNVALKSVIDINHIDEYENTALHLAASNFHLRTVQCLIAHKANPNCANKAQKLPINLAARNVLFDKSPANKDTFSYLLPITDEKFLNLVSDNNKRCLILDLVVFDEPRFIEGILARRPDLKLDEILDDHKQNILHLAIKQKSNRLFTKFITDSALALQETDNNSTILHLAARFNKEIIPTLLKIPLIVKMINNRDNHGNTALHYLTKKEQMDCEIINELIIAGADISISNERGEIPIIPSPRSLSF